VPSLLCRALLPALSCWIWLVPAARAEEPSCGRGSRRVAGACAKVEPPANADLDATGHDWRCRRGYRKAEQSCVAVEVPANASLSPEGNDFACWRGYRREGAGCTAFGVPENADLDSSGHDWRCRRGYRRADESCVALKVPANASLDETGNAWKCWPGYRPNEGACARIDLPRYAELDPSGNAWACWAGYKREGEECVRLPPPQYAAALAAAARPDVGDAEEATDAKKPAAKRSTEEPAPVFEKGGVYPVLGSCGDEEVSGSIEARAGAGEAAGDLETEAAELLEFVGALAAPGKLEGFTPDGRKCSLELAQSDR
jgi:hypothetical protein